jgi:hypothetical protein
VIELTVTQDLPVFEERPDLSAVASADEVAWVPVLEKAVAGLDQAWTMGRRMDWVDCWHEMCEADAADSNLRNPRTGPAPDGYVRLNQGSTSWERAELLTQLTGKESVVRERPNDPKQLLAVFARQLREGKPILVASRPRANENERLPHNLEPGHVYEVVAVTNEGVALRNPWNRKHPEILSSSGFIMNMKAEYTTLR